MCVLLAYIDVANLSFIEKLIDCSNKQQNVCHIYSILYIYGKIDLSLGFFTLGGFLNIGLDVLHL